MARIRSIKPEFWVSEQIAECSPNARLTFVGMWTFCDDNGVHPAKPKTLKAELYPMDNFTADQVAGWVAELIAVGLVVEFAGQSGDAYWHVTGWARHQKIDRPSAKYPPPPTGGPSEGRPKFDEPSPNPRRIIDEGHPPESSGVESRGTDTSFPPDGGDCPTDQQNRSASGCGIGEPVVGGQPAASAVVTVLPVPCPQQQIQDLYHEILPALPRIKMWTNDRQAALRQRWGEMLRVRGWRTVDDGLIWFRDFFKEVEESDFLMGRIKRNTGHEGWKAGIDFLLSPKGFRGVVEGAYRNQREGAA